MVPTEILDDIEPILKWLSERAYQVIGSEYNEACFGNYVVDVARALDRLRIVRDRGQYLLEGDETRLRALGYLRAFNRRELEHAIRGYLSEAV